MLPSSTRDDKKDGNSQIRRASLKLRRAIANPRSVRVSRREFLLILATFLVVTFLLRSRSREPSTETEAPVKKGAKGPAVLPHQKVPWGKEAQNWGDYVAMGLARQKVLEATPPGYADISDSGLYAIPGEDVYRARGYPVSASASKKKRSARDERDRHGVLGGAAQQWSSGVVGSGTFFGHHVDMLKPSAASPPPIEAPNATEVMTDHILAHGWVYLDAKDEANTKELLEEAKAEGSWDKLPLRQRVRDDPDKMHDAAQSWSNIYTAMSGDYVKSSLEMSLERLVRRSPVVVFSKTYCPHSRRAKDMLAQMRIQPKPYIIEVDIRPDGDTLKELLTRKTGHSTFPNVIIGSKSIGGADDLDALIQAGELEPMLKELGVSL